ncbi:hypothetical protein [Streptomyces sp. NEAU-S7GS2]|uniref:hypothetical protein n=1 Tax=Streptomyces sp. NEAU-S7GS2 TaxID=2202000 RepID=UPI000D6F32E1|nr:hypothetical protein [Streptomyces sp. NEAU-S7GS2]AWN24794.1 hypothetical protein DKG71_00115 [Streptomyces sp. NEAU-S7GS2]
MALIAMSAGAATAADTSQTLADGGGGGLLGPFSTIKTSDGLPLSHYELSGGGDGIADTAMRFLMSGLFALSRTVAGFACWLVDWVYRFPIIDKLSGTAQHVADAYAQHIVNPLGLAGIFTAWAFAFGLILVARGRAARGFGEILLTLLIGAIAATSLVRPDMMLGHNGPLQQSQRAALEAASITTQATAGHKPGPCDLITGPAKTTCKESGAGQAEKDAKKKQKQRAKDCAAVSGPAHDTCLSGKRPAAAGDVSRPITRTLTDSLVVQPFQLLQYGQIIDKSSPMYKDYKKGLGYGSPRSGPNACDMLDGKARDLCRDRSKDDPCRLVDGPAADFCQDANGLTPDSARHGQAQQKLLEKHGSAGKAAAAYMSQVTWERVLGALFVLIAAAILAIVVLSMAMAMIAAQFACVLAACATYIVMMWALLPGPNRAVLWKWLGTFATSTVIMFVIADFIPLFGVAARVLLSDGNTLLMERLLSLDGLALTALVMYRRAMAKSSSIGHNFASRMRFAKIGGSHTMGDHAAGLGMALAAVDAGGRGGGGHGGGSSIAFARSGASPAHAALATRRAKLASGMGALSDSTGLPGNPLGALGEARAEARRALAPLSVPMRAAQLAWVGPPRETERQAAPDGAPGAPGRRAPMVIDGSTGEVMSDPKQGVNPIGERLRERISRTRGGRVLLGASRLAWHSTVGAPAAWTRVQRKRSDLTREMNRQLNHYTEVRERWGKDSRAGVQDASARARRLGYDQAMDPLRRASRMERWLRTEGSSLRGHRPGGSDSRPRPKDGGSSDERRDGGGGERP